MGTTLKELEKIIAERKKSGNRANSHSARMLARGVERCAQKFGEEAVELIVALSGEGRKSVISEAADTLYHFMIALASRDVKLKEVEAELKRRRTPKRKKSGSGK